MAARRGQLRPYVQPIIDLTETTRTLGAECLLRWHHPRGVLAAGQFLHLVEEAGLLTEVDLASVATLTTEIARLDQAGRRLERIWLNVSVSELLGGTFVEMLASAAEKAGLRGSRIGLEVQSAVLNLDEAAVKRRLAIARSLGVAGAIDHFHPDLALPHHVGGFEFDAIKLDRSLTDRIDVDSAQRLVVSAVVDRAHGSGAVVIAQGIERPDQVEALRELGCDGAQGYLLGKPVHIGDLLGLTEPCSPPCTWWG